MDTAHYRKLQRNMVRGAFCAAAAAALLSTTTRVRADEPVTMAPPVQGASGDIAIDRNADNASADSVFNWKEVPANQQVPVRRAVFDQGGYQLYDKAGETIVVPFTDNNLYAMKFAVSHDDTTYFVNEGDYPVLYVPRDGYLENATVSGARWYPFNKDFHPASPVFVGIAPSWDAYCDMGWYPGMACYGGYYCDRPFWDGGLFIATPGFLFVIGGHHCWGWDPFISYCGFHPAPFRIAFYDRRVYGWADHHDWDRHAFYGTGHRDWAHNAFGGGHDFRGYNGFHDGRSTGPIRSFSDAHNFGGRTFRGVRNSDGSGFGGGNHSFGGNRPSDDRGFGGGRTGGDRNFGGGDHGGGGGHTFRGADGGGHGFSGGGGDRPASFGGGSHSFGGGDRSGGGGHSFGGGDRSGGGGHSFGGGERSGGGGHSFDGGDRSSGGGHSFGGGDHGGGSHGGGDHGGGGFGGNRR